MDGSPLLNLITVILVFLVIPFIIGFVINTLYMKVLKLYSRDIFKFLA